MQLFWRDRGIRRQLKERNRGEEEEREKGSKEYRERKKEERGWGDKKGEEREKTHEYGQKNVRVM